MAGEESGTAFSGSPLSLWFPGSRCQGGALQRNMEGRKEGGFRDSVSVQGGRVKAKAE